jgi:hypothetical protein
MPPPLAPAIGRVWHYRARFLSGHTEPNPFSLAPNVSGGQ